MGKGTPSAGKGPVRLLKRPNWKLAATHRRLFPRLFPAFRVCLRRAAGLGTLCQGPDRVRTRGGRRPCLNSASGSSSPVQPPPRDDLRIELLSVLLSKLLLSLSEGVTKRGASGIPTCWYKQMFFHVFCKNSNRKVTCVFSHLAV